MYFGFNEEQASLGETVSQLLGDFPVLTGPDPDEARDVDLWTPLAELGLFSLLVPEEHEGVGLSLVDIALAIEALGAGLAPPIVTSTLMATDLITRFGTEAQQTSLFPRIAAGELRIAIAAAEAGQDYDPENVQTVLEDNAVAGTKILVAGADCADLFVVLVKTGRGSRLVLIERDAEGLSLRPHDDLDPSCGFAELILDSVAIGNNAVLGDAAAVARLYAIAASAHACMQVGISVHMLDMAVEYAKTRIQFGQPIGAFQAIKHRCADMVVAIEAGRSAAYYGIWAVAEDAPDSNRASSMAKAYCGEVARDVCNETIQVHGGMGFTWELALHRFLRRAKVLEHSFGDHAWHYERVMAETLAGEQASEGAQRAAA